MPRLPRLTLVIPYAYLYSTHGIDHTHPRTNFCFRSRFAIERRERKHRATHLSKYLDDVCPKAPFLLCVPCMCLGKLALKFVPGVCRLLIACARHHTREGSDALEKLVFVLTAVYTTIVHWIFPCCGQYYMTWITPLGLELQPFFGTNLLEINLG